MSDELRRATIRLTREQIVSVARSWVGTPFIHQGRLKGRRGGVDCVGLPLMVAIELNVERAGRHGTPDLFGGYPPQPVARAAAVREWCERLLIKKPLDERKPGDILAIKLPLEPCHCAFVGELKIGSTVVDSIIHASPIARRAVEHILDATWLWRVDTCFEFPEVV